MVRLPQTVVLAAASRENDHGLGRYEDSEHMHERPPIQTADTLRTFIRKQRNRFRIFLKQSIILTA